MSEKSFDFEIVYKNKNIKLKVDWIEVPSPSGNFVVAIDHEPTLSIIKDRDKIKYKMSDFGKIEEIDTYGGIFTINNNKAVAILDL